MNGRVRRHRIGCHATAVVVVSILSAIVRPAIARAWVPEPATFAITSVNNVPITMSDGTILRADVYSPTDLATGQPAPGPFPVILSETPYGKEAALGPSETPITSGYEAYLVQRGYIAAVVDVRGTGNSGGTFQFLGPVETSDTVTVIKWASQLPRSTGVVGMTGASYLGLVQLLAAGAIGPNSPLKAIFPIVAGNDPYRDIAFEGGILNVESDPALFAVYLGAGVVNPIIEQLAEPNPDLPTDLSLVTMLEAEHAQSLTMFGLTLLLGTVTGGDQAFDEAFWRVRSPDNVLSAIVNNAIPAYLVGGLWDVFQRGEPMNYAGLQNAWAGRPAHSPMQPGQVVTGRYQLLQGPWFHDTFPETQLQPIQLAWFDHWLKGQSTGIDQTTTPLHIIDASNNQFDVANYPLSQAAPTTFFLNANGALTPTPPTQVGAYDQLFYTGTSLPCNRFTEQWALGTGALVFSFLGLPEPCSTVPMSGIPSLTYTTPPFTSATVLAGPVDLTLFATSTARDTEWVATISDVASDNSAIALTGGALLGSFKQLDPQRTWRAADGKPLMPFHPYTRASQSLPLLAGRLAEYDIEIFPTFATLPAGHQLQLVITTGDTPHLIASATQQLNLIGGVYNVQRNPLAASFLELPLAPASAFP